MRRIGLFFVLLMVAASGAGVAYATTRQSATDQYGGAPVIGSGSGTTTGATTTTTPAVTGAGTVDTTATTTATPTTTTSTDTTTGTTTGTTTATTTGTGTTGSTATGTGTTTPDAAAGPPANRVAIIDFGLASGRLRADIQKSIDLAGLQTLFLGKLAKKRFAAFLASPLPKQLAAEGGEAAGRAFGAQLVNSTPLAQQAFSALFPRVTFVPVIRAVLTRRAGLTDEQQAFMDGVATGLKSTGIPLAYVERAKTKPSFVKDFRSLDILTVKDVNKASGQLRLARILLGEVTTQEAVNAIKAKRTAAIVDQSDGSAGAAPWLLLVVLLGGAGFGVSGPARRRLRSSSR